MGRGWVFHPDSTWVVIKCSILTQHGLWSSISLILNMDCDWVFHPYWTQGHSKHISKVINFFIFSSISFHMNPFTIILIKKSWVNTHIQHGMLNYFMVYTTAKFSICRDRVFHLYSILYTCVYLALPCYLFQ